MRKIIPLNIEGSTTRDVAEAWLKEMENNFEIKNYFEVNKAIRGAFQLARQASNWWMS